MRKAVRAIVIREQQLLVMHRNKFGHIYATLPGGRIEMGETAEQALHRELQEETGVTVANPRLVFVEQAGEPYGDQYIYLTEYQGGEPALAPDSEEALITALGQNIYTPQWMPLDKLADSPFVSERLKTAVLQGVRDGFPSQVRELQ